MKMAAKKPKREGNSRGVPPPKQMLELPTRFKRVFDASGLTQKQLEARSGVAQATISQLMRELPNGITATSVARLASELNVSLDYLLMGVESAPPQLWRGRSLELPKASEPLLLQEGKPSPSSIPAPAERRPAQQIRSKQR